MDEQIGLESVPIGGVGRARKTSLMRCILEAMPNRSGCGDGVVAERYIHRRVRSLGSSDCVSAIAKRKTRAGALPGRAWRDASRPQS